MTREQGVWLLLGVLAVCIGALLPSLSWHRHRDDDWQMIGVWRCELCPCGAVRIRRWQMGGYSPVPAGWDRLLTDRHGQRLEDSGWVEGTGLGPVRDVPKPPPPPGPGGVR